MEIKVYKSVILSVLKGCDVPHKGRIHARDIWEQNP
jgi:hypothetical protein